MARLCLFIYFFCSFNFPVKIFLQRVSWIYPWQIVNLIERLKLNNVFARYLFLASVEAVAQTCSVKKVFLEISQNFFYRTPLVAASASVDYFFHYWIKTTRFLVKNRKNSNERWNYVSKAVRRHQKILGQKVKFCSYFLWIFVFNKR